MRIFAPDPIWSSSSTPPSSPGRGFTWIHPSKLAREEEGHLHGGAGWDHVRVADRGAGASTFGHEEGRGLRLLFSTVTVQLRAFGGTGPAAGVSSVGTAVGTEVALGRSGGGGRTAAAPRRQGCTAPGFHRHLP